MKTRLRAKQEDTRTRGSEPSILASKFGLTSVSVSQIAKDLALMQENKIDTSSPNWHRHPPPQNENVSEDRNHTQRSHCREAPQGSGGQAPNLDQQSLQLPARAQKSSGTKRLAKIKSKQLEKFEQTMKQFDRLQNIIQSPRKYRGRGVIATDLHPGLPLIDVFKRCFTYSLKNGPTFLQVVDPNNESGITSLTIPIMKESKDEMPKKSKKLVSFCAYSTPLFRRHFFSEVAIQIQDLGENVEEGMNEFLRQALSMEARISGGQIYRPSDRGSKFQPQRGINQKVKIPIKNKIQGERAMFAQSGQEYANKKLNKRFYQKKMRQDDLESNRKMHEQAQNAAGLYYSSTQGHLMNQHSLMYPLMGGQQLFSRPEGVGPGMIIDDSAAAGNFKRKVSSFSKQPRLGRCSTHLVISYFNNFHMKKLQSMESEDQRGVQEEKQESYKQEQGEGENGAYEMVQHPQQQQQQQQAYQGVMQSGQTIFQGRQGYGVMNAQQQHVLQTPTRNSNQANQMMHEMLSQQMTPGELRHLNSQTPPNHVMTALSPSPATVHQHLLQPCEPVQHQQLVERQLDTYVMPHAPQLHQMQFLYPQQLQNQFNPQQYQYRAYPQINQQGGSGGILQSRNQNPSPQS